MTDLKSSRITERFTKGDFPDAASIDEMTVQKISMMAGMITIMRKLNESGPAAPAASYRQMMLQRNARQTSQDSHQK